LDLALLASDNDVCAVIVNPAVCSVPFFAVRLAADPSEYAIT
jgi:hypothetical protein